METFIMIASSVLTTLGIIGAVWLIFSVRSMQKQLNNCAADIPAVNENSLEAHSRIDKFEDDIYRELDNLQKVIESEMDKRFDTNYRTMYELRDNLQGDVDRLIERDLELSKSKNK